MERKEWEGGGNAILLRNGRRGSSLVLRSVKEESGGSVKPVCQYDRCFLLKIFGFADCRNSSPPPTKLFFSGATTDFMTGFIPNT